MCSSVCCTQQKAKAPHFPGRRARQARTAAASCRGMARWHVQNVWLRSSPLISLLAAGWRPASCAGAGRVEHGRDAHADGIRKQRSRQGQGRGARVCDTGQPAKLKPPPPSYSPTHLPGKRSARSPRSDPRTPQPPAAQAPPSGPGCLHSTARPEAHHYHATAVPLAPCRERQLAGAAGLPALHAEG